RRTTAQPDLRRTLRRFRASLFHPRLDGARSRGARFGSKRLEVSARRAGRRLDRHLVRAAPRTRSHLGPRERERPDPGAGALPRALESRPIPALAAGLERRIRARIPATPRARSIRFEMSPADSAAAWAAVQSSPEIPGRFAAAEIPVR